MDKDKLTVIYDTLVFYKIMHWVHKAAHDEISGFGKVIREKDGSFKVVDAFLLPQRNGSVHTDIEASDLAKAEYEMRNTPGEIRLWWHSHVQMAAFWSGTDKETIELLGKHGWFLATVFNQKWEHKTALYIGGEHEIMLDDLSLRTHFEAPEELKKPWEAEFETCVTAHKPKYPAVIQYDYTKTASNPYPFLTKVRDFSEWREAAEKSLKRGEKNFLRRDSKNPVVGIVDTHNYGRLYWRVSNVLTNGMQVKDRTPGASKGAMKELYYYYLMEDMKEIAWGTDEFLEHFISRSDWWKTNKAIGDTVIELEAFAKPREVATAQASLPTTTIPTNADMRMMFKDWDSLPESEQDYLRNEWARGDTDDDEATASWKSAIAAAYGVN